jgi:ATP-dependent RNA helicase RhlB
MATQVLSDIPFGQFDLHPRLAAGLADCGFARCTPIQALTLPVALAGRDVAGKAQTGTGKTCAFLVAVMNRLLTSPAAGSHHDNDPRAVVIAPTRELAVQIDRDARAIGRHTGLRFALVYGGVDYERQRRQLREGCDVIIATPGRLIDYFKQRVFRFQSVEVAVIDEADRLFDLGFIKDVRYLLRRMPPREKRQSMLFSATLSYRVMELAYEHMNRPQKLVVETGHVTVDRVRQQVYFPATEEKIPLLVNLLEYHKPQRSIVFVNTRAAADRVTQRLHRQGFEVGALSGNVPQVKRQRLLERFTQGRLEVLVATDVAARGLHIPDVTHIFNYDLPQDGEDYVHRIGRTARLGAEGDAISFACDLYAMNLPDIERYIGMKIPVQALAPERLQMPSPRARAHQPTHRGGDEAPPPAAAGPNAGKPATRKRRRRRRHPASPSAAPIAGD